MFLSGIFQNSISQVLPSACRYFAYLIFANLSYLYVLQNGVDAFIRINKKFLVYFVILSLFWGIVEIISGDIDYLNGAYRFAGSFKKHQLATALFIYVLLVLYREFFLKHKKKIFSFCVYFILLGFLVATQSRAVLGIFFIVHFLYYLFRVRSIRKLISLAAGAILVIGIIYYAIVYTDFMPRYKTMLIGDKGIYDASTLERLDIMYNSIDNLKGEHKIWGIGLGGFESFYNSITGRQDVAAHNNYML
ncbi:MAG: O-antigen ligase family protein [Odoribacter splanchnicus]